MPYIFKERNPPDPWFKFKSRTRHAYLLPFFYLSWLTDWAAFLLGKWPLVELLEYLGSFSILFAAIFYFAGAPDRLKQKHYQAWQVINTAEGKGGNGGRIDALQELNRDKISLIGVNVAGAYLEGVRLMKAKARRANFNAADLRNSDFNDAELADASLIWANLRGADLRGCNFTGARLDNADLSGANLADADLADVSLKQADLTEANLRNVKHWNAITNLQQANIAKIQNAPAGFAAWARKMGAIETNSE